MTMIRANSAWAVGKFGNGIRVAVIDTGIATHPNLQVYGGISFVSGDSSYHDNHGHGTHCAGIIAAKGRNNVYGVAFGSHLFAVKALADNGSGMVSWVIQGMNWCISQGINVISMSLGSSSAPISGYTDAVKRCEDRNISVVCASGNSFNTSFPWVNAPANSLTTSGGLSSFPIAVASVTSTTQIASSSSRGTNSTNWNPVTVSAPGVSIFSTHLDAGYATMSGTSMACPHVSGIVALIKESNPGLSPTAIKTLLAMTSQTLGSSPFPNTPFGYGLIDCVDALGIVEDKRIPSDSVHGAS
jgi:subtilisin